MTLVMIMKTIYDVQQLLKRFGTIIYTGNPLGDLELIQDEVRELYNQKLIDVNDFKQAVLIIRASINKLQ
jgi:uncharacterized protein YqgQ